jgi:hypothetical protein
MSVSDTPFFKTNKPYVRWWWFSERMDAGDILNQVRWISEQAFGGVEIAWVYPLPGREKGPAWLSAEWAALVRTAKDACERLGMGCDFTLGSLWPFGDSALTGRQASQWYAGPSPQRIDRHWQTGELPGGPPVMNHLDRKALEAYGSRIVSALAPALRGGVSCLFCDSWEVEEEGRLWTAGFGECFRDRFGYQVEPFMSHLDEHPKERYDYRVLVGQYALDEFYRPYAALCRDAGGLSRVQCHGAPADIVAAYAEADVPESEALLFDPAFSRFAASAAAIKGKEIVSCESFTCLYGWNPWPAAGPHLGKEKIGDLKLLADALAAHGVNRFVWHGMPFATPGRETRFYASVHVGPDGALAPRMKELNQYLENISRFLREGKPAHRVACLLPLEDARMKGELPAGLRKPSARYWWEFQHPCLPPDLKPWSPLWVTDAFLGTAECLPDGALRFGNVTVMALIVDCHYLDASTVRHLAELSTAGARIIITRLPLEPGRARGGDYGRAVSDVVGGSRTTVSADLRGALRDVPPFLEPDGPAPGPDFFVREHDGDSLVFAAHPAAGAITYPMEYDAASKAGAVTLHARFHGQRGLEVDLPLSFAPGGSVRFRITARGSWSRETVDFPIERE